MGQFYESKMVFASVPDFLTSYRSLPAFRF